MSENRFTIGAAGRHPVTGCPVDSEGLLIHIYGESAPDVAELIGKHLPGCGTCRAEMASLRETLETIDHAELSSMAEALALRDAPGAWDNIASQLESTGAPVGHAPRRTTPYWLQAAAVLLIAGASFLAGVEWMSAGKRPGLAFLNQKSRSGSTREPGSPTVGVRDPGDALREFTAQTDGYLNRCRIVLLEIANADTDSDSAMLREATRSLLAETRDARQIADQIPDSQLDEVLGRLESILIELSSLTDWNDKVTVKRIRDQVNDSGLLEQIEILTPPPTHLAHKRTGR